MGSILTVLLLDPAGNEQWRHNEIPGAAESIAFAQDEVIAAGQFREDTGTVFAVIALALDNGRLAPDF